MYKKRKKEEEEEFRGENEIVAENEIVKRLQIQIHKIQKIFGSNPHGTFVS